MNITSRNLKLFIGATYLIALFAVLYFVFSFIDVKDLKNYELEQRISELESKFSKDMSETTFNEIKELKKQQKIN